MYEDPVLAEIRAIREAYAARFNYDLRAIAADARAKDAADTERTIVRLPPRRPAGRVEPPAAGSGAGEPAADAG